MPFYLIDGITIFSDLILIVGTSVLTGIIYDVVFLDSIGPIETFLGVGALTGIMSSAILSAAGAYRPRDLVDFRRQASLITLVWLFVFFVLSAVAFSLKISETYSRGATLTFFVVGWAVILTWHRLLGRYLVHAFAEGRFAKQRVLLLAESDQLGASNAFDDLESCGYLPVRTFHIVRHASGPKGALCSIRGSLEEIINTARQEKIECVFLLVAWDDRRVIDDLTERLRALPIPVYLLPDNNVAHILGNRVVNIGNTWLAELKRAPLSRVERICKRALDLLIASAGVILLAPIMLIVAAIIKLDSRGPVLFRQTRDGFNGRSFRMCKFRTMSVLEDGAVIRQAIKNDPRCTRFGRFLRRTNIDELPQLFNVIAGEMSLVGPRPHATAHNTEYGKTVANYAFRFHVKPGLTGWAQIHGLRGETRTLDLMEKRIQHDLWYIDNWSIWLDFKILFRTLTIGLQPAAY